MKNSCELPPLYISVVIDLSCEDNVKL